PAADHQSDCERLRAIDDPSAKRLVRQAVAAFEQKTRVQRKREGDDLVEQGQENDVAEDMRANRVPKGGGPAGENQSAKQQHAPDQRDDADLPLQPVISGGLVLVHAVMPIRARRAELTLPSRSAVSAFSAVIALGAGDRRVAR